MRLDFAALLRPDPFDDLRAVVEERFAAARDLPALFFAPVARFDPPDFVPRAEDLAEDLAELFRPELLLRAAPARLLPAPDELFDERFAEDFFAPPFDVAEAPDVRVLRRAVPLLRVALFRPRFAPPLFRAPVDFDLPEDFVRVAMRKLLGRRCAHAVCKN